MAENVRRGIYRQREVTCRDNGRFTVAVPEPDRFWQKVHLARGDGCWEWAGAVNASGYGVFRRRQAGTVLAHRYAYEQMLEAIPEDYTLDHLCENPACVRPSHLEPVTISDNLKRRWERRRARLEAAA